MLKTILKRDIRKHKKVKIELSSSLTTKCSKSTTTTKKRIKARKKRKVTRVTTTQSVFQTQTPLISS